MNITNEDRLGILYFFSKENPFRFRVRLQKLALIAKLKFGYPFNFDYKSHYYGPYSDELTTTLDLLCLQGLVNEKIVETQGSSGVIKAFYYEVTLKGLENIKEFSVIDKNKELFNKLDSMWQEYGNKSTGEIIKYAKEISGLESKPRVNS